MIFKTFLIRLFLDGAAGLKFLLEGDFQDLTAVIEAHLYFYRNLGKLKKKRRRLQQKHVSKIYNGNIAYEHYIKGMKKYSDLDVEKFS